MKWEMVKLGDVINIAKGKKHNPLLDGKNRYINIEDLHNPSNLILTNDDGTFVSSSDLIIAWDGANAGKVGVGYDGVIGSTLARLRLNRKDIDSNYLFWYLESKNSYIKSQRTGATIPHVNGETLKQIQIPLPPLTVQKEIAEILDTADALFGDPVRNEKGWEEVKLIEIIETGKNKIRTGPFGSDLLHSEFVESGITVLGIDNIVNNTFEANKGRFITEEKFTKLARYQVYPQDVLITIMGTIGRSAVVPNDIGRAINTKHIVAMTVNKEIINPHFLSFTLTKNVYVIEQMKKNQEEQ